MMFSKGNIKFSIFIVLIAIMLLSELHSSFSLNKRKHKNKLLIHADYSQITLENSFLKLISPVFMKHSLENQNIQTFIVKYTRLLPALIESLKESNSLVKSLKLTSEQKSELGFDKNDKNKYVKLNIKVENIKGVHFSDNVFAIGLENNKALFIGIKEDINTENFEIFRTLDKSKKLAVESQIVTIIEEVNNHCWSNYYQFFEDLRINKQQQNLEDGLLTLKPVFNNEKDKEIIKIISDNIIYGLNEYDILEESSYSFIIQSQKFLVLLNKYSFMHIDFTLDFLKDENEFENISNHLIQYYLSIFKKKTEMSVISYLIENTLPYLVSPLNKEKLKNKEIDDYYLFSLSVQYNFFLLHKGAASKPGTNVQRKNLVSFIKDKMKILNGDKSKIALSYLLLFAADRKIDYLMRSTSRNEFPKLTELANAKVQKAKKEEFKVPLDNKDFSENNFLTDDGFNNNYDNSILELNELLAELNLDLDKKQKAKNFLEECEKLFKTLEKIKSKDDMENKFYSLISLLKEF